MHVCTSALITCGINLLTYLQEMNRHIKQCLVELLHTQMHRLLQLLYCTAISCIQETNNHDKQRLAEFYKVKIGTKKRTILSALISIHCVPIKLIPFLFWQ